jgi:hypothetical protein
MAPPSLILELDGRGLDVLPPGKNLPIPLVRNIGWALKPIWKVWGRDKFIDDARNQTPIPRPSTHCLVAILPVLSRLQSGIDCIIS